MLTIIGSNSTTSINREVAKKVNELVNINILDIDGESVPLYSPELEAKGFPSEIQRVYDEIKSEDTFVLFTPEYNGFTTPYFKNIFDWVSRIEHQFLKDKKVVVISVSPGQMGGASVRSFFEGSLHFFGASETVTYGVGDYYTKLEENTLDSDVEAIKKLLS